MRPSATGVFVTIEDFNFIITAKHVVFNNETSLFIDEKLHFFTTHKIAGQTYTNPITRIKKQGNVNWIFHSNKDVDIAIMPVNIDWTKADILRVPLEHLVEIDNLLELDDLYYLSYQPGLIEKNVVDPIMRTGSISKINKDKTYFIDGFAFPGNSGSPVFFKTRYFKSDNPPLPGSFIGIIGSHVTYQGVAISRQTKRPRITFEENTGLSKVWSVDFLKEIIKSKEFSNQFEKVRKLQNKKENKE